MKSIKAISKSIKNWYLLTLVGILFIILGVWVFRTPLASYLVLATFFSISFLTAGVAEITFAIGNRKEIDHWGWYLASGVFSAMIGVLLLSNPELSMTTLPLYVGFGVLFRSIAGVSFALSIKDTGAEYQSLLWLSIGGIILSFLLIWNPGIVGMTLVSITSLIFILLGIIGIIFSLKLKNLHRRVKNFQEKLHD